MSVNQQVSVHAQSAEERQMIFTAVESDPETGYIKTWASENNVWEIGIYPVMFGVRVRAGKVGCQGLDIDYCAGTDPVFLGQLLTTVMTILETFPESLNSQELHTILPMYNKKPINLDPCWEQLQQLAKERLTQRGQQHEKHL